MSGAPLPRDFAHMPCGGWCVGECPGCCACGKHGCSGCQYGDEFDTSPETLQRLREALRANVSKEH